MTKQAANDSPDETPATLVNAFLGSATAEFASLVQSPNASWSVLVEHATSVGLVPVAPEQITGFFFATATFANEFVAGSLTFGDREYLVNTVLGPSGSTARYGLWEWADAFGYPNAVPRETSFVLTVSRLSEIIAGMVRAVATLQDAIATAPVEIFSRMERAREKVQADFQSKLREDDHRRAAARAAEAFRSRDYQRVVNLLEPFVDVLTPAESNKLAYARRHAT